MEEDTACRRCNEEARTDMLLLMLVVVIKRDRVVVKSWKGMLQPLGRLSRCMDDTMGHQIITHLTQSSLSPRARLSTQPPLDAVVCVRGWFM